MRELIGNSTFNSRMKYTLEKHFKDEELNKRVYNEMVVETDGRPKAQREFHMSDTVRGNAYATTRVVCDTLYAITARRAL